MMAKLPSEASDHYRYDWWSEGLPTQGGAVTAVYTDALMSAAYVAASGVSGDILYCKMVAAVAKEIRAGHQVQLRSSTLFSADTVGKVLSTTINGNNSCVAIKLFEDANDVATTGLFDTIQVIGSVNPQASDSPDAISYQPVNDYNYMQIFRTALEIAGTTLATKTRVGDWYQHEKTNALRMHSIEMEKAFLWGIRYLGTGSNGKPEYTTGGMIRKISTNAYNYTTDTDYSGKTWLQGGEDWLMTKLAALFKYGGDTRLCYAGVGAILAFSRLAQHNGQVQVQMGTAEYGIKVMSYMFPFGELYLKRHPLFSYETVNQYSLVAFEPKNLKYRYMKDRDTHFRPDDRLKKGTWTDKDAIKEGWLSECGLEMHIEPTFGYFNGVGKDSAV